MMVRSISLRLILSIAILIVVGGAIKERKVPESGYPEVCYNQHLISAIKIIDAACKPYADCDMATLQQLDNSNTVDKRTFFSALSEQSMKTEHIFFETDVDDIHHALHWKWKKGHVDTLATRINRARSVIYVIGQASHPGSFDHNYGLSRRRADSVVKYLQDELGLKDVPLKVGWLGEEVMQLTLADAELMRIDKAEFDGDTTKLNQGVHVFVFPCAERLRD